MKWILIVIIWNWNVSTAPSITVQELSSREACLTVKESVYKSIEKQPFIADIQCVPNDDVVFARGKIK